MTKEDLRTAPVDDRLSVKFSADDCIVRRTSGSTGVPIRILEEFEAYNVMRAYQFRRLLSYGFRPGQKVAFLDPRVVQMPPKPQVFQPRIMRIPRLYTLVNVPMHNDAMVQLELLRHLNPEWLFSNPSELRSLASLISTRASVGLNLRGILTWGELLDTRTRDFVESTFGTRVFDGYGAVEVAPLGGLAWECDKGGFHLNADCVILEFLKDGEPVAAGETGEVVATSLFRYAMPTIRYALRDHAVLSDEDCECGRALPLIKSLEGRMVDCLISVKDELVSPFRIMLSLQEVERVGQYQIIQEEQGQIVVNIATDGKISKDKMEAVMKICSSLLGEGTKISINTLRSIENISGKKFQPLICRVPKNP